MGVCNQEELVPVNPKREIFFNDYTNLQAIDYRNKDFSEKIKFQVFIKNINTSYQYKIKMNHIFGQKIFSLNDNLHCSILNNSIIKLDSPIIFQYFFEKQQNSLIEIFMVESGNKKNMK